MEVDIANSLLVNCSFSCHRGGNSLGENFGSPEGRLQALAIPVDASLYFRENHVAVWIIVIRVGKIPPTFQWDWTAPTVTPTFRRTVRPLRVCA